jgi:hypothetical protein
VVDDVFVSVGRPSTPEQETFILEVERCLLEDHNLRPRTLGRNEWSSEQPLRAIKKRMQSCSGAAIVAFERVFASEAEDKGRAETEQQLRPLMLTTIWNQIEASMAYTLGLPILVLAEKGLRDEGLLENRYDWAVEWLSLDTNALMLPRCRGVMADWAEQVRDCSARRNDVANRQRVRDNRSIEEKTISELIGELKPSQARALVAGSFASLAALTSGAFALGMTAAGG